MILMLLLLATGALAKYAHCLGYGKQFGAASHDFTSDMVTLRNSTLFEPESELWRITKQFVKLNHDMQASDTGDALESTFMRFDYYTADQP